MGINMYIKYFITSKNIRCYGTQSYGFGAGIIIYLVNISITAYGQSFDITFNLSSSI